ncbi:carbohydrate ABC transporter permease [Massiliimalia massiliensis]|uniref:carbohydrate ABC transporter permease n=1 Tax=Massiliimalia massiliensis TaxID=1852384 RepID=UPI0009871B97|nr:carbohydrate ABC transporter permease [Massiliimalia massiliensis]
MSKLLRKHKGIFQSLLGLIIILIFLFPIYWMLISSFKTSAEIFANPPTFFPKDFYLGNYSVLFKDIEFLNYFKNSAIIAVFAMAGSILLAAPISYALARKNLKGAGIALFLLIIIQMVPSNSIALPLYAMFSKWGLTNSFAGVIVANITSSLPFIALVLRTSFLAIPQGLEDAAYIDGCSNWKTFFRIVLPLTLPALVTCAAFSFIFAWGEFIYALVLLPDREYWTITVGMRTFIGQHGTKWGNLMATATVSSLPVIIIFILTQKHIVGGITAGSVKG